MYTMNKQLSILTSLIEKEFNVTFARYIDPKTKERKGITLAYDVNVMGTNMTIDKFIQKYVDHSRVSSISRILENQSESYILNLKPQYRLISYDIFKQKSLVSKPKTSSKPNQLEMNEFFTIKQQIEEDMQFDENLLVEWNVILMSLLKHKSYKFSFLSTTSSSKFLFIEKLYTSESCYYIVHDKRTSFYDMKINQMKMLMDNVEMQFHL